MPEGEVVRRAREYSTGYFVPELKDELAGYLEPEEVGEVVRLLGGLRLGEFTYQQLQRHAIESSTFTDSQLRDALKVLFECSALGNVDRLERDGHPDRIQSWRYRNRNAGIDFDKPFVVHRGAWHALNLLASVAQAARGARAAALRRSSRCSRIWPPASTPVGSAGIGLGQLDAPPPARFSLAAGPAGSREANQGRTDLARFKLNPNLRARLQSIVQDRHRTQSG